MPLISRDEWLDKKLPVYWIRVSNIDDTRQWAIAEREMASKWLEEHTTGWVYWDGKETYMFEHNAERIHFKIWATDDPFNNTHGEII